MKRKRASHLTEKLLDYRRELIASNPSFYQVRVVFPDVVHLRKFPTFQGALDYFAFFAPLSLSSLQLRHVHAIGCDLLAELH
jgi:hypothetical protein